VKVKTRHDGAMGTGKVEFTQSQQGRRQEESENDADKADKAV